MNTGKKRLSGIERKQQIIETACRLFAKNGFDQTSTKQLASAANCSEALLYKYFDSKSAIMDELLREWTAKCRQPFKLEIIDQSAIATLKNHYEEFLYKKIHPTEESLRHEALIQALNSNVYYREKAWEAYQAGSDMIKDTIVPIIRFGQEQGELEGSDAETFANFFVCYMIGAQNVYTNFPDRFTPLPFEEILKILSHL